MLGLALNDLTSLERTVFLRHYLDGRSIKDMAAALDTSEGAVDQALRRAKRRLRARLKERGFTEADLRSLIAPPPAHFNHPIHNRIKTPNDCKDLKQFSVYP